MGEGTEVLVLNVYAVQALVGDDDAAGVVGQVGVRRDNVGRDPGKVEADGRVGLVTELLLAPLDVPAMGHFHLDDVLDLGQLLLLEDRGEA